MVSSVPVLKHFTVIRKLKKEEQSLLCAACHPDIKHIPVKLHEDIPNSY